MGRVIGIEKLQESVEARGRKLEEDKAARQALGVGEKVRDKVLAAAVEASKMPVLLKRMRDAYRKSGNAEAVEDIDYMLQRCKDLTKRVSSDAQILEKLVNDMREIESDYRQARMKF